MTLKLIKHCGEKESFFPVRAYPNDVGADVFSPVDAVIKPHETVKIGLGFGVEIPIGYAGFVYPRSGMSSKGIICQLPPIDPGYTGEIHAVITNTTDEPYEFNEGAKIGQLVVLPCVTPLFTFEIDNNKRGSSAFGSTGA